MNTKERHLVAAITEERQQSVKGRSGGKKKIRSVLNNRAVEIKSSKFVSIPDTEESGKEDMIDLNDYVNINLEEGVAPIQEVLDHQENSEANLQFKCDQCDFKTIEVNNLSKHMQMTSHYPPSDPLMYLDPKWVKESKAQCNLCPRAFKTLMILKQHIGRSHKTNRSAKGGQRLEHIVIKERLVIKSEEEGQFTRNNIPAHLVTEDLQREIISRYVF